MGSQRKVAGQSTSSPACWIEAVLALICSFKPELPSPTTTREAWQHLAFDMGSNLEARMADDAAGRVFVGLPSLLATSTFSLH